jgi:hypothetical protein
MIWPFKKREPVIPFSEFVKTLDPAPCGKQEEHYEWELGGGMPCPICVSIEKRKQKDAELDALADKIVARLQRTPGVPGRDPQTLPPSDADASRP